MTYSNLQIAEVADKLRKKLTNEPVSSAVTHIPELRALYAQLPQLPQADRADFGKQLNELKTELEALVADKAVQEQKLPDIDVTAPFDVNVPMEKQPAALPVKNGSVHPLMRELTKVLAIFNRMGFTTLESRQLDTEYYMFSSLNFPEDHPARDDYDTFTTKEGLVAPAHASIMQNRVLKRFAGNLEKGAPISAVYAGRTFRNEDVDARHEHTFYQVEIMHVDKDINAGNLIATFKTFLETYYEQAIEVRSQPFYFPFTEPSFELALSCPFCQKKGCHICSQTGWIELLGMGLVHPNVLKQGGVDPEQYTGFAGGLGLERLVMMKYGIEDVRNFESGKLDFLRQFS